MVEVKPNTPVLVGVAAVQQKIEDFEQAQEPLALMEQALRAAVADAGSDELVARCDEIMVPKGMWGYTDPARLLARRLQASRAKTVMGEIGVLQQTLLNRACQRIVEGEAEVVFVTGGEAKYRALCAAKAGAEAEETSQSDAVADTVLVPDDEIWSEIESATGLGMPVGFYAIIDSALRYKQGLSVAQHRDQMAQMYQRFSEIAVDNPDAWVDQPVEADYIREGSARNRMLAFPYTKLHNTQWNVDQAAGLIFTSAAVAEELGIARSQWIFPRASTESNFMTVVASRADLGGSPGFNASGRVAMEIAGVDFNDIKLRELYSCFPAAVRVQAQEFGLSGEGDYSVTGAMTFGGGPLNNFVFQSTVKMAQLCREAPQEIGLVTTVSGMLTKQACALWSAQPNPGGWAFADVTEEVRANCELRELVAQFDGEATVAGYTVLYQGDSPWRAVAVFDLPDNQRTAAYSEDAAIIAEMLSDEECCGRRYRLGDGQFAAL
jgi:acetyl-CoA C-acetyltransferase